MRLVEQNQPFLIYGPECMSLTEMIKMTISPFLSWSWICLTSHLKICIVPVMPLASWVPICSSVGLNMCDVDSFMGVILSMLSHSSFIKSIWNVRLNKIILMQQVERGVFLDTYWVAGL